MRRDELTETQEGASRRGPLVRLPVEPMDGAHDPSTERARDDAEETGTDAVVVNDVITAQRRVERGKQAVDRGIEVFAADRGQAEEAHPTVLDHTGRRVEGSNVGGDLVPAGDQTTSEPIDVVLDAGPGCRQALQTDERDPHA